MKTKIILLSIFLIFTIQVLASSSCNTQRPDSKVYNQTLFVFVVDPNVNETDKLLYILEQLSCGIPTNPNFQSSVLKGDPLPASVNNLAVFQNVLSNTAGDFCSTFASDLEKLTENQQNIQLIVTKSKQDQCSLTEAFEQFKSSKPDLNVDINIVLLDDSQVTGYNVVHIPIDSINLTEVVPPTELSNKIEQFVTGMIKNLDNDIEEPTPASSRRHPQDQRQDEDLEPWMIVSIIIVVILMLIGVIIGSICIRNRIKKKSYKQKKGSSSGTLSAENERPSKEKIAKKVSKAPLRPNPLPPSSSSTSGLTEPIKLKKKQSTKTKSTLSYSITLESVKSKKNNGGSKESASKESASKETVGSKEGGSKETASAEKVASKTKMKTAEEPSKKNKGGVIVL